MNKQPSMADRGWNCSLVLDKRPKQGSGGGERDTQLTCGTKESV